VDGLDEVPSEKFSEMINHIKEFSLSHCPVSIIFSCRKLFYTKYNIGTALQDFDTYELYALQHDDVNNYINSVLGSLAGKFSAEASLAGISSFLYHPFYLVNIAEQYIHLPHKLPGSKTKVIDNLISQSFDVAQYRKIKGSELVKDEHYQFNDVIEKFAFALQLAGLNTFHTDMISELFTADERLLLQHNSLITHSADSWGFINALFQEHIAAKKLAKLEYETIVAYCTVGIKKNKDKMDTNYLFAFVFAG
jgi:hypothetical protein